MTARERILEHLRSHGKANVAALSEATGLAGVTVRHHVGRLREEGLVEVTTERIGRGRPRNVYRLSSSAVAQLDRDQAYQSLAADLLGAMKSGDADAGRRFFREMARAAVAGPEDETAGTDAPLVDRLNLAVQILAERGFDMRLEADRDGYVLRASDCPYRDLSAKDRDVCCLDQEIIQRVVGGDVERESWFHAGGGPCAYRVQAGDETARD